MQEQIPERSILFIYISLFTALILALLFRSGFFTELPLRPDDIRHAHSHLMVFGFAVPSIMYLTFSNKEFQKLNILIFILSLTATLSFMFTGYRSIVIHEKKIPLSVILSSLIMIAWYSIFFIKIKMLLKNKFLFIFYLYLILATSGAWGVAFIKIAKLNLELYAKASTSFFLSMITEGFLYPLSLMITGSYLHYFHKNKKFEAVKFLSWIEENNFRKMENTAFTIIILFAPFVFLAGIFHDLSSNLKLVLRFSIFFINAAAFVLLFSFLFHEQNAMLYIKNKIFSILRKTKFEEKNRPFPITVLLLFLFLKPLTGMAAAFSPDLWFHVSTYRIIYLHTMLLGGTSLMIFFIMQISFQQLQKGFRNIQLSSITVVLSLYIFLFYRIAEAAPVIALITTALSVFASGMLLFSMIGQVKRGS